MPQPMMRHRPEKHLSMPKREKLADFALRLRETDDVAVIKRPVRAGTELFDDSLRLIVGRDIPAGHKLAVKAVPGGAPVRKYGQIIGFAKGDIAMGEHVHTHNLEMKDFARDYEFCADARPLEYYPADRMRHFQGYARPGGCVGTRNYIAVISSVNCSVPGGHSVKDRSRPRGSPRVVLTVEAALPFTRRTG